METSMELLQFPITLPCAIYNLHNIFLFLMSVVVILLILYSISRVGESRGESIVAEELGRGKVLNQFVSFPPFAQKKFHFLHCRGFTYKAIFFFFFEM